MKINWFSPLPPAKTDIAHYTARILSTLCKFADITLWADQPEYEPELEKYAKVKVFCDKHVHWKELNVADINIFNIGNHPSFHESIWQISLHHPGIIILHDFRLQHLFAGIYKEKYKDRKGYLEHMKYYYGKDGFRDGNLFWDGKYDTEYMAENYPLTYLALQNALGVVVHSSEVFNILKEKQLWPLIYLPLPFPATERFKRRLNKNENKKRSKPFCIIVFGYFGPNRQLDAILKALYDYPKKEEFCLHIYGKLWDKEYLEREIKSLHLEGMVIIHGFVPEEKLDMALSEAHLAFNLRYPTMGEASGSQLRIWNHCLPSIVTRAGWFATLSEEVVAFVDPKSPINDIKRHLDEFLNNSEKFFKMGEKGRKKLELEHNPMNYIKGLINFIPYVKRYRLGGLSNYLARRVGAEITNFQDAMNLEKFIRKTGEEIYLLTV